MEPTQLVPFGGVASEIGRSADLPRGADRGQMPPVFAAARGKLGVTFFCHREQIGGGSAQGRGPARADRAAQEHPAAFFAALGQGCIAQDPHMTRDARLALPQHLRQFADRQLHRGEQAHDAQPGRVSQCAQGGIDPHCAII